METEKLQEKSSEKLKGDKTGGKSCELPRVSQMKLTQKKFQTSMQFKYTFLNYGLVNTFMYMYISNSRKLQITAE